MKCARKNCRVQKPEELMYMVNGKLYCSPTTCPILEMEDKEEEPEWVKYVK